MTPLILVTNDDGIHAEGLEVLAEAMQSLGEVVVCAPESERSGSSHAITLHTHLRAHPLRGGWWRVSGTPVDCVYLAIHHLCSRRPDLVVSGINPGFNLGTDVFYSGTVGGAAEGYLRGVSAMAISADRGVDPRWAMPVSRELARAILADRRHLMLVNVNVPGIEGHASVATERIEGVAATVPVAVTRLGNRVYEDMVDPRTDPMGRPYYWIGGPPTRGEDSTGDDTHAVRRGTISVTPLEMNITASSLGPAECLLARANLNAVASEETAQEPAQEKIP